MFLFFFNDTATTEIYTLSLHDALPIYHVLRHVHADQHGVVRAERRLGGDHGAAQPQTDERSEEHTSELQSLQYLVCRLLLEKKTSSRTDTHPTPDCATCCESTCQPYRG